jgi:hypothetical protein
MPYAREIIILNSGYKNLLAYNGGANLDIEVNQGCRELLMSMVQDMKDACAKMATVPEDDRRSAEWALFIHDALNDATQDLHPFQHINGDTDEKLIEEVTDICKTLENLEGGISRSVPEKFSLAMIFCKHLAEELANPH